MKPCQVMPTDDQIVAKVWDVQGPNTALVVTEEEEEEEEEEDAPMPEDFKVPDLLCMCNQLMIGLRMHSVGSGLLLPCQLLQLKADLHCMQVSGMVQMNLDGFVIGRTGVGVEGTP